MMTTNTDPVRALIGEMTEYLDQQVDPELDVIAKWRDRLESALAQQPAGVEDGPIDASDNAEYIEHCADRLERCGLRVTAGALRVIAHEHRALAQQPAETSNARGEWVLVPVKPTEAMREAFHDWRPSEGGNYAGAQSVNCQVRWEFRQRYAAMLAAARRPPPLPQQPAAGEEIMVNAAHGVFTLPLQPSGLNGPRFVVHVPAPEQQPAAPSGEAVGEWVLVPREPTDAMLRAAQSAWLNDTLRRTTTMWRAMLEAAPQRPAAGEVDDDGH